MQQYQVIYIIMCLVAYSVSIIIIIVGELYNLNYAWSKILTKILKKYSIVHKFSGHFVILRGLLCSCYCSVHTIVTTIGGHTHHESQERPSGKDMFVCLGLKNRV